MEVGDKIWKININKVVDSKITMLSEDQTGVIIQEYKVIGSNVVNIAIDDTYFTTIRISDLNNTVIDVRFSNHFMGDGVFVSIISTSPPDKQLLERMVYSAESEVKRRYGWLADFAAGLNNLIEEYGNNTTEVS